MLLAQSQPEHYTEQKNTHILGFFFSEKEDITSPFLAQNLSLQALLCCLKLFHWRITPLFLEFFHLELLIKMQMAMRRVTLSVNNT